MKHNAHILKQICMLLTMTALKLIILIGYNLHECASSQGTYNLPFLTGLYIKI